MAEKFDPRARRRARRALVQAIYQWQLADGDVAQIRAQFALNGSLERADADFFEGCLKGVVTDIDSVDSNYVPHLDREPAELDHVERAILRAGTYELQARIDVPYKVVIDEYVALAKTFGAQDSFKYVNGVLDGVARKLRTTETR